MSIILCTQHKGGAGKTTLAVHLAGVLTSKLNRILLIDCDTQRNAWFFYFRTNALQDLFEKSLAYQNALEDLPPLKNIEGVLKSYSN